MKGIFAAVVICLLLFAGKAAMAQKYKTTDRTPAKENLPLKDVKSKQITVDVPCNPTATVFLENIFRRVNIILTNENKVRLVTTVYYQGEQAYNDAEWLEKLDLSISGSAANVVVKTGNNRASGTKKAVPMPINRQPDTAIANGIAVFDSTGEWKNRKSDIRRNVMLYVPSGVKLDIESRYSDITLENNAKNIKLRITNGSFTMKDAEQFTVNGVYGNIYAGALGNADIEITSGRFKATTISKLEINSKNSFIEANTINQLLITSNTDNYDIEELGTLRGQKDYGDLRVTSLKNEFDLKGKNADIKIRSIDDGVGLIKIEDQYADLRLPAANLKNYAVNFEGSGGNLYASFQKTPVNANSFTANVGNITGKHTRFQLKCDNCSVDFK